MTAPFSVEDFSGLLDDAAVFPPGNLPIPDAVREHLVRRSQSCDPGIVGPLVVSADHVASVQAALDQVPEATGRALDHRPLDLSVVAGDTRALTTALSAITADTRLALAAVEFTVHTPTSLERTLDVVSSLVPPGTVLYLEPGWGPRLTDCVALLDGSPHRLKIRTGGTTADAFPTDHQVAHAIMVAHRHKVAFKATAGLHHGIRHHDPVTGFEHHGFLNLLAAAAAADDGHAAILTAVAARDPHEVIDPLVVGGRRLLTVVRTERFVSFGTCDVLQPQADLYALGLLGDRKAAHATSLLG